MTQKEEKPVPVVSRFVGYELKTTYDNEDGTTEEPILQWEVRNGYPRMKVFTKSNCLTAENKYDYSKIIIAPFVISKLRLFFKQIKYMLKQKQKNKPRRIDCLYPKFENGKKTNGVVLQASVYCGLNDEGVVEIWAEATGKRTIKFPIEPNQFFNIYNEHGDIITHKATLTKTYAPQYFEDLDDLLRDALKDTVKKDIYNKNSFKQNANKPLSAVKKDGDYDMSNVKPSEKKEVTIDDML